MPFRKTRLPRSLVLLLGLAILAQAHVGSPDIYLDGKAGPYQLFITIRPPAVIPGVAELEVRAGSSRVRELRAAPVPLDAAGAKFAPVPEALKRSAQDPQFFTGSLWMMALGSWQVRITADGEDGKGVVAVPVPAYPVTTKPMQFGLEAGLALLMFLLVGGLVVIAGASVREAKLPPGTRPTRERLRKARIAMVVAAVVVLAALWVGRSWWRIAETDYRQKIYKPLDLSASLRKGGVLTLTLTDPGWLKRPNDRRTGLGPAVFVRTTDDLVPDHNHLMHLYAIRQPGLDAVYHLHPEIVTGGTFRLQLPRMEPGDYRLYADIVHANGFPETPVGQVHIPPGLPGRALEGDDAGTTASSWQQASTSKTTFTLPDGYTMEWVRQPGKLRAKEGMPFEFRLLDPQGRAPRDTQFYMGMLGHAAFVKTDGTTFAHIHPTGSVSMTSFMMAQSELPQQKQTNASGMDMSGTGVSSMDMNSMDMPGLDHSSPRGSAMLPNDVSFPYGFPGPGRYRIFVQMKHGPTVETGVFDADVQ